MKLQLLFAGALIITGVVLLGCGGGPPPPPAPSALLAKPLPKIERRALDGSSVSTSEAQGRVIVVKFFAKYCEPCKQSLPAAERLRQQSPEVLFIGIAEDEFRADVEEMIATYKLGFPVIHDRGNVLAGRFRVSELPRTFVSGRDGKVFWVADERHSEADLRRAIAAAGN